MLILLTPIHVIAVTQYDYYDDDVAHQGIDGYTLLGLLILVVIGFALWILYSLIKEWTKKNMPSRLTKPKPKSPSEILKEEIYKRKKEKELEWEAMEKEKLKKEAIEILKKEYCEPHILDGITYVLEYENLDENKISAFTRGYIWGNFRSYSYLSLEEFKKRNHPIVVLGYIRGLQEKDIWIKFGKCPVWEPGYILPNS